MSPGEPIEVAEVTTATAATTPAEVPAATTPAEVPAATEVTEVLAALRTGELTLEEVADCFRRRSWPRTRRAIPRTSLETAEQQDPEPDVPGSYDELTGAYDKGELTAEQYDALCEAVAGSIRAE